MDEQMLRSLQGDIEVAIEDGGGPVFWELTIADAEALIAAARERDRLRVATTIALRWIEAGDYRDAEKRVAIADALAAALAPTSPDAAGALGKDGE